MTSGESEICNETSFFTFVQTENAKYGEYFVPATRISSKNIGLRTFCIHKSILTIIFGTNNVITSADCDQNRDCRHKNTENIAILLTILNAEW